MSSDSDSEDVALFSSASRAPGAKKRKTPQEQQKNPVPETRSGDTDSFHGLGVKEWIIEACASLGIRAPTPVQKACIPAGLAKRDVVGCAQTGSGKTAAFAIPMLHHLSTDPYGVFGIVLTPTRELAYQIAEQFSALGASIGVRVCVLVGGMNMMRQAEELQRRPHIVIATPGRLCHHLRGPSPPHLSGLHTVVLDEADRLLERGAFDGAVDEALNALPHPKQLMLFSATMPPGADAVAVGGGRRLRDPVSFRAAAGVGRVEGLVQEYVFMPAQVKACYLLHALRTSGPTQARAEAGAGADADDADDVAAGGASDFDRGSTIVFVSTCYGAQLLTEMMRHLGVPCVGLHSAISQGRRLAALAKFRSGEVQMLVATDVASRGLDIPSVQLVLNYDLPRVPEDYVHRIGRTARAGRRGRALSLVTQYDVALVQTIEGVTGQKLAQAGGFVESEVLALLSRVLKAQRMARVELSRQGFEDRFEQWKERRKRARAAGGGRGGAGTGGGASENVEDGDGEDAAPRAKGRRGKRGGTAGGSLRE